MDPSPVENFDFDYEGDLEAHYELEKNNGIKVSQKIPSSPPFSPINCSKDKNRFLNRLDKPKQDVSAPATRINNIAIEGLSSQYKKRRRELDYSLENSLNKKKKEGISFFTDKNIEKNQIEEDRELKIIEKILNVRKHAHICNTHGRRNDSSRLKFIYKHKLENISNLLPKWPFIKLLGRNKSRIYVRFHSENFELEQIDNAKKQCYDRDVFPKNIKQQLWSDAQSFLSQKIKKSLEEESAYKTSFQSIKSETSWTEKYKPTKYHELLSDESCNRRLLKWLKLWDNVVFSKPICCKTKHSNDEIQRKNMNSFNKKTGKFEYRAELKNELDELNYPIQKVVLLAGEPGLGKTTLAHCVAKYAGYESIEINASNDRTSESFREMLENTQIQNVFSVERRPNLLIFDEIDGAPTSSIELLIRFVSSTPKFGKENKNNFRRKIRRPIICICNDLYATSLRQLRAIAYVIIIPPIESTKLVKRLWYICLEQHLKTNISTLYSLTEKTSNDIR